MNQDQVKEFLLKIEEPSEDFFVIFSGKTSKKANGIYHPDTREIIIHNRNFDNDNALMYTAIHEFAHHIHFTTSPMPVGPRSHTLEFRSILHRLLARAEDVRVYLNPFESDPDFASMTQKLRREVLTENGRLMKAFGAALVEAERLCREKGARFDDYIERALSMDMRTASTLIRIHNYDVSPELGYGNMATVAGIRNDEKRAQAERAFEEGQSPDMVKVGIRPEAPEDDPLSKLERERRRIQRTIRSLESKLTDLEQRIQRLGGTSAE